MKIQSNQSYSNNHVSTSFKGFNIENYRPKGSADFFVELGKTLRKTEKEMNTNSSFDMSRHVVDCVKKMKDCAYQIIVGKPVAKDAKGVMTPSIHLFSPKGELIKTVKPEAGLIISESGKSVKPKACQQIDDLIDEAMSL